jgi:site-specific DNA-cytosine methylase
MRDAERGTRTANSLVAYNITFCDANGTRKDRVNGGLYVNETDVCSTITSAGIGTNVCQRTDVHAVAYSISPGARELKDDLHILETDTSKTLETSGLDPKLHQGGMAIAFSGQMSNPQTDNELTQTLGAKNPMAVSTHMQVRRLTPCECERLQGFPDDYTLIPVKGKPAADGPRYKALGNSMACNVMHWIGERIQMVEEIQ